MAAKSSFPSLDKKIPRNPKYQNVRGKIDTGASITKQVERQEYNASRFRKKKDEPFRRIKVSTFAQLVLEVIDSEELRLTEMLDEAATFGMTPDQVADMEAQQQPFGTGASAYPPDDAASMRTGMTGRSTASSFADFANGTGERRQAAQGMGVGSTAAKIAQESVAPYLLLDLREADEYDQCHINGALSFPHTRLNRASNIYTPEVLAFLNRPGKIVIVYDIDEKIASEAAATMVQRGAENVFLLSGGMRVLVEKFPDGFLTGPLPAALKPAGRRRSSVDQQQPPATAGPGVARGVNGAFTRTEVEKIRQQLEENLLMEDDASSMASTARTSRPGTKATSRPGTQTQARRPGTQASATARRSSSSGSDSKAWR